MFSKRCKYCGKILISEVEVCSECRQSPVFKYVDCMYPLHSYNLWKKDLMFKWKKENFRNLSYVFADVIDQFIKNQLSGSKEELFLVPVPPRPKKLVKKGWDQINDLADILSKKYKVLKILERTGEGEQKKLSKQERLGTQEVAYRLKENVSQIPESVILLDDVVTTGATLEKCAGILKENGVKKVTAIALFRVE
ncbi:MAG: ComF family protein [Treponema sp.]|nr:ComF family protein [Treponema sp.]